MTSIKFSINKSIFFFLKNYIQSYKSQNFFKRHRFHIITKNDSLPFFVSFAIGSFFFSFINYIHYDNNSFYLKLNFFFLMLILFDWFYIVNKEAVNGFHTKKVQVGILKGMILFIVSEIMFFFSIFWSFFTFKINPSLYIECIFPPKGIDIIKMNCFPLLNTVFLVYSGLFLMNSFYYLKKGRFNWSFLNLVITIILGLFFVLVQFKEYSDSVFSFNDSCYGSVFFLLTGFHGFHVIVGLIFLLICCYRLYLTNKFNYYKINKNLFWRKIIKTIYIVQILNFRINESRDTFSINYWINRNKNEYSSININTLSQFKFEYITIFCIIINFDYYKSTIKLSDLKNLKNLKKKKKFF